MISKQADAFSARVEILSVGVSIFLCMSNKGQEISEENFLETSLLKKQPSFFFIILNTH